METIHTERTYLRAWKQSDFADIHAYSGDPETTKYFFDSKKARLQILLSSVSLL